MRGARWARALWPLFSLSLFHRTSHSVPHVLTLESRHSVRTFSPPALSPVLARFLRARCRPRRNPRGRKPFRTVDRLAPNCCRLIRKTAPPCLQKLRSRQRPSTTPLYSGPVNEPLAISEARLEDGLTAKVVQGKFLRFWPVKHLPGGACLPVGLSIEPVLR